MPDPFELSREWRALWIQPPLRPKSLQTGEVLPERCLFREEFCLYQIDQLTLFISAGCGYELYINGVLVPQASKASQFTWKNYDAIDVAPYLKSGQNCFAVVLQRDRHEPMGLVLELLNAEGELVLWTDGEWRTTANEMFNQDWQFVGFNDRHWERAIS
ncbi:hypothetical protein SH580_15460 [Coraliomargarita algicola]|uniref:Bacterial alpha-L-rhamnosidase N-terminal domain-containing protein n=1 Tax=Coraliomargarita algicola TaxID=3092156 RepID=A0ABZ0RF88_9BACT|nr:hypothetical protein [Coraliomargarita sp. J2-16]WPJ94829.1 hypothetical protein SH580_15460 [Coraliomargarita sp. J2-16]